MSMLKLTGLVLLTILVIATPIIVYNLNVPKVCINNSCYIVGLAKTPDERARGLMYKKTLDKNSGMLFVFPVEKEYSFWMRNTFIPLDIIWINKDKEIVHIKDNALPCLSEPCEYYSPNAEALYVLEINAGESGKFLFEEGDKVEFRNIE